MLSKVHRHRWPSGPGACTTCGMTRGRASRAGGDRNTIKRFLRSSHVSEAMHKMGIDPVTFAKVTSAMIAAVDIAYEGKVARTGMKASGGLTIPVRVTIEMEAISKKMSTILRESALREPALRESAFLPSESVLEVLDEPEGDGE